jgi:D-beta-D-heptose 7-phosphate kinase / D-beta-D-heptose 1-phosphate adenosyltransferase
LNLVIVGDTLLDRDVRGRATRLSPDAPVAVLDEEDAVLRPGGAGLASVLAAGDGHRVTLVTALAADEPADWLRAELQRRNVEVLELPLHGPTPEKIRFFAGRQQLMRLDRGTRGTVGAATAAARAAIGWADAVLVSDYGRGVSADGALRSAMADLSCGVPVVWDPHPRGTIPVSQVTVATPNESETDLFASPEGDGATGLDARAETLRQKWQLGALCMTRGPRGALLVSAGEPPLLLPARPVAGGDPCGAGDRFASRLAGALAGGDPLAKAAADAIAAASEFVACGGARGAPREHDQRVACAEPDALSLVARVRGAGGTVVATGGCFDLLHAGHVGTLTAARELGDCLVVCINSDVSVRRLKGPGRPLVSQDDRGALLAALGCVDAVVVFDDDTPERVLRMLRPDIWAKGGDYAGVSLPESGVLSEWGGRAVLLPYVEGRSTTRLIKEATSGV